MRIAITGASGLVGAALAAALRAHGHQVIAVSRRPIAGGVRWDPARRELDTPALGRVDAVVHLAGENIAGRRWTAARKQQLWESRIPVTRWLSEVLTTLAPPPRVLVSASAVGIYGDRGDDVLTEDSPLGDDFLARLARDWEAAADPARDAGVRVVHPRFGVILSRRGGALARMLPPFRVGLGGPFGDGRQWMSWITIDDVLGGIAHALVTESVAGPVNFTADKPVRNAEFAHALGRALHRPAVMRVPAVALRLAFGEMADATVLASQRVMPAQLQASGYQVRFSEIGGALEHVLGPR